MDALQAIFFLKKQNQVTQHRMSLKQIIQYPWKLLKPPHEYTKIAFLIVTEKKQQFLLLQIWKKPILQYFKWMLWNSKLKNFVSLTVLCLLLVFAWFCVEDTKSFNFEVHSTHPQKWKICFFRICSCRNCRFFSVSIKTAIGYKLFKTFTRQSPFMYSPCSSSPLYKTCSYKFRKTHRKHVLPMYDLLWTPNGLAVFYIKRVLTDFSKFTENT